MMYVEATSAKEAEQKAADAYDLLTGCKSDRK